MKVSMIGSGVVGKTIGFGFERLEHEVIFYDRDIGICMNPEFLTEITDTWTNDEGYKKDFFTEDRIVIGEYDKNLEMF